MMPSLFAPQAGLCIVGSALKGRLGGLDSSGSVGDLLKRVEIVRIASSRSRLGDREELVARRKQVGVGSESAEGPRWRQVFAADRIETCPLAGKSGPASRSQGSDEKRSAGCVIWRAAAESSTSDPPGSRGGLGRQSNALAATLHASRPLPRLAY